MLVQKPAPPGQVCTGRVPTDHGFTAATAEDLGIDTPGKFLDTSKAFVPSFDLQVSKTVPTSNYTVFGKKVTP